MRGQEVLFSHKSDSWETPQWLFDELNKEFNFGLDAAASKENSKCTFYWDESHDALTQDWFWDKDHRLNVFVNPPYSKWQEFVKKAHEQNQKYGITVVMLLPSRTALS